MSNPIVSTLPAYVDEQREPLIAKSVLGAKSAKLFTLQTGVKGATALNLVNTDVVFGDGSDCGWDEAGSTELTQRQIVPAYLKVNMPFCDKALLGKWASYKVQVAAGNKTLPFEEDFVNGVLEGVQANIEKMIYQGDSSNPNEFDGMIKILNDAGVTLNDFSGKGSAYASIQATYLAMPEAVATKEDAVILVSDGLFRQYVQDLVDANLYHFEPNDTIGEYTLPGTACKVIAVSGLDGASEKYIIAGRLSNMFYGTDLENDSESFDLWYSKDNREFRLAVEMVAGVQVAFPTEITFAKA